MTSVLDSLYNIIGVFFPADLLAIPFFNFLVNLFFFAFCCFVFCLFVVFPLYACFRWAKGVLHL